MSDPATVYVDAPAKINLFLRVLGREVSGYHQIETLFAAVDFCDELRVERTESGVSIEVSGADVGPEEDNLAHRAARAFLRASSMDGGAKIHLAKNIPAGAGLGGGSSDAGAMLRALNVLFGTPLTPPELLRLAVDLGADVPFFTSGAGRALAWGRGERMLSLAAGDDLNVLLALPALEVATAEAYGRLTLAEGPQPWLGEPSELGRLEVITKTSTNHFEASVFARYPELGDLRGAMESTGALTARLSGSGAALFALFGSRESAERASESLAEAWTGVRFVVTRTLANQPAPRLAP